MKIIDAKTKLTFDVTLSCKPDTYLQGDVLDIFLDPRIPDYTLHYSDDNERACVVDDIVKFLWFWDYEVRFANNDNTSNYPSSRLGVAPNGVWVLRVEVTD